jgi:flavin-dependent dehydrogenase
MIRDMDIGIIGAGPAGAHLARELASSGSRVTLYDHRAPWEKPCGGGAPWRAVAAIGLLRELPRCEVWRARLQGPGGEVASVDLAEPLIIFSRNEMFRAMLHRAEQAGVRLDRRRVRAAQAVEQGIRLDLQGGTAAHHDFVAGADGARSLVRRSLGRAFEAVELTQAAGYYTSKALGDEVVLRFCGTIPGYAWYFPRPDHASVGVCSPLGAGGQGALAAELDRFCADWGVPKGPAYGALIPCSEASAAGQGIAGPHWALIGDAAGVVDPITREGIYYAVRTAELLSRAFREATRVEEAGVRYAALVRHELGAEMQKAHRLQERFYRPRFTRAMVYLTRRSPRLCTVMAELLACRQGYVGLKRRLMRSMPAVGLDLLTSLAPWRRRPHR